MPVRLYVNGELMDEQFRFPAIENFTYQTETPSMHLGRYNGFNDTLRDFDGVMSDMGLWAGRALDHQEVALIGGLGRAGMDLASSGADAVLALFNGQSGTVKTGDWVWSYTTTFATPADGSPLGLGKHYYGQNDRIYVVLGGSEGNWSGVTAEGGEPFAIPIQIVEEPVDVAVNLGEPAVFAVTVAAPEAISYQWYFRPRVGAPVVALSGQTSASLNIASVAVGDNGIYFAVATEAGAGLKATSREARLVILNKPTELYEHWLLNETATDLAALSPTYEPAEDRLTEAPLANALAAGKVAQFRKGASVDDFGPLFGSVSGSPVSTGSLGINSRNGHIALGSLPMEADPFALAFWFNRNSLGDTTGIGDQQHLLNSNQGLGQNGRFALNVFSLNSVEGTFNLRFFHNNPDPWAQAGGWDNAVDLAVGLQSDQYYHFAMTRDSSGLLTFYLNGDAVFSAANPGSFTMASLGVVLGNDPYRNDRHFLGFFDDVRFYDGAISAEEVSDLIGEVPFQIAITSQPWDQTVNLEETAIFSFVAEADGPVDSQWFHRTSPTEPGQALAGETGASLSVENVGLAEAGFYYARITQVGGGAAMQTRNAQLIIADKPVQLIYHLRLNEVPGQMPANLDPAFEPSEERVNSWDLSAAVGNNPTLIKGGLADSLPQFAPPSPGAAASGSTGALGPSSVLGRIQMGDLSFGLNPFTAGLWFKMDAGAPIGTAQRHVISSNSDQAGRWNLVVQNVTGGSVLRFFHNSADSWGTTGSGTAVSVNANSIDLTTAFDQDRWYYFAMTRDDDNLFRLFLDGEEVWSANNAGSFTNSSNGNGVWLGRRTNFGTTGFVGLFDDFRIYDGALTPQEINDLAHGNVEPPSTGFDAWAASFGLDPAGDGGPTANPTGDGVSNLLKYAFGMDPNQAGLRAELPESQVAEGGLTLTYTRLKNADDLSYRVDASTDLVT